MRFPLPRERKHCSFLNNASCFHWVGIVQYISSIIPVQCQSLRIKLRRWLNSADSSQVLHFIVIDLTLNWFPRWTWPIWLNCSRRQLAGSCALWRGTHPDLAQVMWEWFSGGVEGWSGHWPASVWTLSEMRVHLDAWEVGQGLECSIVKPGRFFNRTCLKTIFRHNLTSSVLEPKGVSNVYWKELTHWLHLHVHQ